MKLIFYSLAILNSIDATMTFLGLKLSLIEEANPTMRFLYETEPLLFLGLKLLLSIALLVFGWKNVFPRISWFKPLIYTALSLYAIITCLHAKWVFQVIT
ncbi:phosphoglycerol transferase MdoB-like AlkP superfamily enzyme [Bacillus mesophilus]|uniref:DUF5658 domain-containing protein n=1 Tax=Bacillus mesophilus TaxID=1808955 RepID=A0A6M0Q9H8_9BACI|nr:DUF5658 family protein [Bacillus mesophilus]MBM7662350.1 phosphoglycerol transferase MdoB-like AlkP superfamily enzyme [Bacillus mesophilus]NEY73021.1 hypothetical protein [Bacillus mesophilus]